MERKKNCDDLFGPGSSVEKRIIRDFGKLAETIQALRLIDLKIVLTSGTYDLKHVGHDRYLEVAKSFGDILVVGLDGDDKVKKQKGPHRPIVSEDERAEMLCHCRHVDLVFIKRVNHPHWELVRTVRPDVLITVKGTYEEEDLEKLRGLCGQVEVLEYQAPTSTTAKIRRVLVEPVSKIKDQLIVAISAIEEGVRYIDTLIGSGVPAEKQKETKEGGE